MEPPWYVAHTRPRAEKKVADYFRQEGWTTELPLYASLKVYRGKRVTFYKTLFPGYLFVRLPEGQVPRARQNQHVAQILVPPDQAEFADQLQAILAAVSGEREIRVAPAVVVGKSVRIIQGPLRGVEGVVVERMGVLEVVLRLDFIGQGAAVRVAADELELV